MCCKKRHEERQQLKKLKEFLNKNRIWLCLESCVLAPECQYCKLIYQINYSYKHNKSADLITFRNSVFGRTFSFLEEIYNEHKDSDKWLNYDKSFKKSLFKKRNIFRLHLYNYWLSFKNNFIIIR